MNATTIASSIPVAQFAALQDLTIYGSGGFAPAERKPETGVIAPIGQRQTLRNAAQSSAAYVVHIETGEYCQTSILRECVRAKVCKSYTAVVARIYNAEHPNWRWRVQRALDSLARVAKTAPSWQIDSLNDEARRLSEVRPRY